MTFEWDPDHLQADYAVAGYQKGAKTREPSVVLAPAVLR